jgi:D-alanyl-D-alanine carboxypeptidase
MKRILLILLLSSSASSGFTQQNAERLNAFADSIRVAGNYPGLSFAVAYDKNEGFALVSGFADIEKKELLQRNHHFLQGSVGKTYVSAIAVQLISGGQLNLDDKVSKYLAKYEWYRRIPNAPDITIRMIMNHTSGVMRYEFKESFTEDLSREPGKVWKPEDLLRYIWDEKASFPAGEGWEYSDTNYILLGMIIEEITGKNYYKLLRKKILEPFNLLNTHPSDKRKLDKLVQGYAGEKNVFGGENKMIDESGFFIINPQFEWTGGGIYSTTEDLAKWGKLLYENKVADTSLMLSAAVPAKLGRDVKYGLGVIIRQTPLGIAYGHSGFFPGYLTEMLYFPKYKMCVAVQANSSDFKNLKLSVLKILIEFAKIAQPAEQ